MVFPKTDGFIGNTSFMSDKVRSQYGSRAVFLKAELRQTINPITIGELTASWLLECNASLGRGVQHSTDYKQAYKNIARWIGNEVKKGRLFVRVKNIPPYQYNGYLLEDGPVVEFEDTLDPGEPL